MNKIWTLLCKGQEGSSTFSRRVDITGFTLTSEMGRVVDTLIPQISQADKELAAERILQSVLESSIGYELLAEDPNNTYTKRLPLPHGSAGFSVPSLLVSIGTRASEYVSEAPLLVIWEAGFPADKLASLILGMTKKAFANG